MMSEKDSQVVKKHVSYHTCCVCDESKGKQKERTFHRFPNNLEMRKKWIKAIGKKSLMCMPPERLPARFRVCSAHFQSNDYITDNRIYLKPSACPSKFDSDQQFLSFRIVPYMRQKLEQHLSKPVELHEKQNEMDETQMRTRICDKEMLKAEISISQENEHDYFDCDYSIRNEDSLSTNEENCGPFIVKISGYQVKQESLSEEDHPSEISCEEAFTAANTLLCFMKQQDDVDHEDLIFISHIINKIKNKIK